MCIRSVVPSTEVAMRRAAAAAILVPSTCTIDEAWIVPSAARRAASASAAGAGGGAPDRLGAATPDGHSSVVSAASSTEAATTSALRLLLCIGPPLYGSADGSPAGATGEEPPLPAGGPASGTRDLVEEERQRQGSRHSSQSALSRPDSGRGPPVGGPPPWPWLPWPPSVLVGGPLP